jgi:hypothetical protein
LPALLPTFGHVDTPQRDDVMINAGATKSAPVMVREPD